MLRMFIINISYTNMVDIPYCIAFPSSFGFVPVHCLQSKLLSRFTLLGEQHILRSFLLAYLIKETIFCKTIDSLNIIKTTSQCKNLGIASYRFFLTFYKTYRLLADFVGNFFLNFHNNNKPLKKLLSAANTNTFGNTNYLL